MPVHRRPVRQFRQLVRLGPRGTYALDLSWFQHHLTGKHLVSQKFIDTFGPPRSRSTDPVAQHYADIAYALQATLEVVHVPGLLRVRVSDDGCGGARVEARGGLAGLAERVRTVDGRLQVSSPPHGPTVVTVELPSHA